MRNSLLSSSLASALVAIILMACVSRPQGGAKESGAQTLSHLQPLPFSEWRKSSAFAPLVAAAGRARVVQLGESIHLTREMPLVRLGALKALHQESNFDVLAIEGSAVDTWLAMDGLVRAERDEPALVHAQQQAFFPLWVTSEMREVLKVVADSLEEARPLYMASFDSQLGTGMAWRRQDVLTALVDALIAYGLKVSRQDALDALKPLEGARYCVRSQFPKTKDAANDARRAIALLEGWIADVRPKVERALVPHARALTLLPNNLRNAVSLCEAAADASKETRWRVFQEMRDKQNAHMTLAIADGVSSTGKIVTWAHHSHVHHNTLGKSVPSMGEHLKAILGHGLYTVGTFAISGKALVGQDEPALETLKDGPEIEINVAFRNIAQGQENFFLDLRSISKKDARYAAFFRPATARIENSISPLNLAGDFDGVLVLEKVSAPQWGL